MLHSKVCVYLVNITEPVQYVIYAVIPWVMWSLYSLINQISIVDSCQRSPEQFVTYINMDMNGIGMTKLCACSWHVTRSQTYTGLCIAINFMYKSLNDDNNDLNVFMKTLSYCNSFCLCLWQSVDMDGQMCNVQLRTCLNLCAFKVLMMNYPSFNGNVCTVCLKQV